MDVAFNLKYKLLTLFSDMHGQFVSVDFAILKWASSGSLVSTGDQDPEISEIPKHPNFQ